MPTGWSVAGPVNACRRLTLLDQALTEPRRLLALRRNEVGMRPDETLSFERPELRDLLEIWRSKRQSRPLPSRADLSPFDLKAHLGHLFLLDVERDPLRFRYRLIGTAITRVVDRDATGCYFEDIYSGRLLETAIEVMSWVVRERAPLRIFSRTGHARNRVYLYDGVLLPLAKDGETVDMILGGLRFTIVSAQVAAED
jgi:hypothetical protein